MASIEEKVRDIIVTELGASPEKVVAEAKFVEDLGADSLDTVELVMAFEEEFSTDGDPLEISDDDAANIATVSDAVTYLKDHGVSDD